MADRDPKTKLREVDAAYGEPFTLVSDVIECRTIDDTFEAKFAEYVELIGLLPEDVYAVMQDDRTIGSGSGPFIIHYRDRPEYAARRAEIAAREAAVVHRPL